MGLLERIDESPAFFRLAMATQATSAEGSAAVGGALMMIGLDMIRVLDELVGAGVSSGDFRSDLDPDACRGPRRPADLRRPLGPGRRAGPHRGGAGGRRDL